MSSTPEEVSLVALHADTPGRQDIINQCCAILNYEWPRSESLRLRSLNSSSEDLPTCLALLQSFKTSGPSVLGHARVTRIPSSESGVWIESVVIHPDLRGRGWGKYLMLKVEEYCTRKFGTDAAYLCTVDKQAFYSRLGYTFCDPIVSYGGNPRLIQNFALLNGHKSSSSPLQPSPIHAIKDVIERQIDSVTNHKYLDTGEICAQNFSRPTHPVKPPTLASPPRRLPSGVKNNAALPKETRICLNKDYMKKKLSLK